MKRTKINFKQVKYFIPKSETNARVKVKAKESWEMNDGAVVNQPNSIEVRKQYDLYTNVLQNKLKAHTHNI